jgi:MOSC domain-containing protein YiiM
MTQDARVQAVFVGRLKEISDERGTWSSSIFRDRVEGPVYISFEGLAGDKVAQPYHSGLGAAVCVHLADHYAFWKAHYNFDIEAGSVGENITLANLTEDKVCVGDVIRLGTAIVQVSGPRVPCANLARRIGRPDFATLTIRENRTGFYLRVLERGFVKKDDFWSLQERLNHDGSISAVNRCMYLYFDPDYARKMIEMAGLEVWWKDQARQKLEDKEHWTSAMKDQNGM